MITAQIASLPERVDGLNKTVNSLINQVDMLFVGLNKYDEVPGFLTNNRKIVYALMDNSLGDAAKFYGVEDRTGYVLTCDDDLVYPEGYARYMVQGVKDHGGIVTLMGRRYDDRPIYSYRTGFTEIHRALVDISVVAEVHVGGTCAMAFHTDNFKITTDDFLMPNMADLWVAKAAHEQGVKIHSLPHPKRYLHHTRLSDRMSMSMLNHSDYQTEVINSFLK